MLAYAIFVTFVLGAVGGSYVTILVALHMEDKKRYDKPLIDPTIPRVGANPFIPVTLDD